ncbi:putative programmed cell death protein [Helianthus annuus]|nr:putative programmed cell death protein [Helianthus annuus]
MLTNQLIVIATLKSSGSGGGGKGTGEKLLDTDGEPHIDRNYPHYDSGERLVSMAMDRHDREKEMASVLLSTLYSDVISSTQIKQGFFMLLESADDLAVDIYDTVELYFLCCSCCC